MDWAIIGTVGEVVGGVGVVVSLLYLARQVRVAMLQEQRARYDAAMDSATAWAQSLAQNQDLSSIVLRGALQGMNELSPNDRFRFYASMLALFRAYERISEYAADGSVHSWGRESFVVSLRDFVAMPGVKEYWLERRHWFAPRARAEVDRMVAEPAKGMSETYSRAAAAPGAGPLSGRGPS